MHSMSQRTLLQIALKQGAPQVLAKASTETHLEAHRQNTTQSQMNQARAKAVGSQEKHDFHASLAQAHHHIAQAHAAVLNGNGHQAEIHLQHAEAHHQNASKLAKTLHGTYSTNEEGGGVKPIDHALHVKYAIKHLKDDMLKNNGVRNSQGTLLGGAVPKAEKAEPINAKPPKQGAPKISVKEGETVHQAITRHVQDHAAHLETVRNDFKMNPPHGHAAIMMGMPGSGKSTYLNQHHLSHGTHLHVDVDGLKHLAVHHPDYPYSHYDENNTAHVVAAHPFSKQYEEHMYHEATKRRLPVALDTTGGNHKRWGQRIDDMKQKGYHHVALVNVRVSKKTSEERNQMRARTVPQSVIDDTFAEHDRNHPDNHGKTPFEHLSAKADSVHVVDHETSGRKHERSQNGWKSFVNHENNLKGGK